MNPTPKAARAALTTVLQSAVGAVIHKVYGYELAHEGQGPCWLTVQTGSIDPTTISFDITIYVQFANPPADQVQDMLDDAVNAADEALAASSVFGPSNWEPGFREDLQVRTMDARVTCVREDMFD